MDGWIWPVAIHPGGHKGLFGLVWGQYEEDARGQGL